MSAALFWGSRHARRDRDLFRASDRARDAGVAPGVGPGLPAAPIIGPDRIDAALRLRLPLLPEYQGIARLDFGVAQGRLVWVDHVAIPSGKRGTGYGLCALSHGRLA